jgi:hypothetical protein
VHHIRPSSLIFHSSSNSAVAVLAQKGSITFRGYINSNYFMTSGFRRDADEICALLGYNAASSGNPLPTFRCNVSVSRRVLLFLDFLTVEDRTDTLSRNVGKGLPFDAA